MSASQQAAQAQAAAGAETQDVSLLDQVIKAGFSPQTKRTRVAEMLDALVEEAMHGTAIFDRTTTRTLNETIKKLDEKLSNQLSVVLHNAEFQKLEGSWRGLRHLVFGSETSTMLKIRVLNIPKNEMTKDLEDALEFDQSELFKKIYSSEYDMPGGEPYACLLGDYEFSNHPQDIGLLEKMSGIAAAGFCPFISAASHELFGFNSWTDLPDVRDLAKIFDTVDYIKWRSFRDSPDSRFVTLVCPRVLSRLPYGANTKPIAEFNFEEVDLDDTKTKARPVDHNHYAWMNAAYVMGTNLTRAFSLYGFCTAIRGVENGGKVEGLPAHIFRSDDGDLDLKCPTEVGITDRRENELSRLGFLPLCHFKNTDYAVFFGAQTCHKPKKYDRAFATANEEISARLPYIMATSRFAHYLKTIARDKIGSFMEREDCEKWLNRWINNYVNANPTAGPKLRAQYPLREAKVEVEEVPGKPGAYNAKVFMRPWLQLEELTASLSMVAEIPSGKED